MCPNLQRITEVSSGHGMVIAPWHVMNSRPSSAQMFLENRMPSGGILWRMMRGRNFAGLRVVRKPSCNRFIRSTSGWLWVCLVKNLCFMFGWKWVENFAAFVLQDNGASRQGWCISWWTPSFRGDWQGGCEKWSWRVGVVGNLHQGADVHDDCLPHGGFVLRITCRWPTCSVTRQHYIKVFLSTK